MNAINTLKANDWVKANSHRLESNEFGGQKKAAAFATNELGFKVSTTVLRDLMQANGIPTARVSEAKRNTLALEQTIRTLQNENGQLKKALAKIKASEFVPDDLKQFVFAGLDDEITAALSIA